MIDTPWFRGLALGLFLLGGASAEGLALHPHNETLPLAPFRPDLSSPWSGAARPGDQVLLPRDDLPESPGGLQVRLQGERHQRVITPEETPEGMCFAWPGAFNSGEWVTVSLERSPSWEELYRQGRRWVQKHVSEGASFDEEGTPPPLPEAARMMALDEGDPVIQRVTTDPGEKTLLLRGRNLRGSFTVHYPDGSSRPVSNDANANLRLPYGASATPGPLSVTRDDGRHSNPVLVRFPRKITGLLVLPEGASVDLGRVEIFPPSRLAQEKAVESPVLRDDGAFVVGMAPGEELLGVFIRSPEGEGRVLVTSVAVPPEEDSLLVVLSPEDLARSLQGEKSPAENVEKP